MPRAALVIAVLGACSGKAEPEPEVPPATVPHDASVDGITAIIGFDPASGMHLDDDGTGIARPVRPKNRPTHPIDIVLRSSPTGALAAVDGVQVGLTPAYWFGESDGREHEFTFALRGYGVARYRFVPIQGGVVHATLQRSIEEARDGGVGQDMLPPSFTPVPDAAVVVPPPTVITPVDAQAPGLGPAP